MKDFACQSDIHGVTFFPAERKKVFKDVLSGLNLDRSRKLSPDAVRQFSLDRGCKWTPETPADLAWNFLMKVHALDVTARESILRPGAVREESGGEWPAGGDVATRDVSASNPLDVLCASVLCSDGALQRQVLASMHRCGFALPSAAAGCGEQQKHLNAGSHEGRGEGAASTGFRRACWGNRDVSDAPEDARHLFCASRRL